MYDLWRMKNPTLRRKWGWAYRITGEYPAQPMITGTLSQIHDKAIRFLKPTLTDRSSYREQWFYDGRPVNPTSMAHLLHQWQHSLLKGRGPLHSAEIWIKK